MASRDVAAVQPARHSIDTTERVGFRNVLVATDLSSAAEKGIYYAEEIAKRYGARLYVVHVQGPPVYSYAPASSWPELAEEDKAFREESRIKLEERLQPVPHELIFQEGEVCETLADLTREKHADLLVVGTHGRSGIEKVLMGSVAERLFRESRCPVLTVGPKVGEKSRNPAELSRILYATDFSAESLAGAPYAISLAREHRANLVLLNCFEGGEDGIQAMLQGLRQLVPFGTELRCQPFCIVERGPHGQKILDVAESHAADLIVLGVDGASKGMAHNAYFRGSSLYKIVTQATCPVLTVRA